MMRREETEDMAAGHPDAGDPHAEYRADSTTDSPLDAVDSEEMAPLSDIPMGTGDRNDDTPRGGRDTPLLDDTHSERFRTRWHDVQASFVDDPQRAVRDADQLVAELMQTLATTFAERKQSLESRWQQGGNAETEDLRLALRGYHSFFDQLLPH